MNVQQFQTQTLHHFTDPPPSKKAKLPSPCQNLACTRMFETTFYITVSLGEYRRPLFPLIKMRADKRKLKIRILAECRLLLYKKVKHVIHLLSSLIQSFCLRRQFEKLKDKKRTNYVLAFRTLKIYAVFLSLKVYCSESVQIALAIARHQSDSQKTLHNTLS